MPQSRQFKLIKESRKVRYRIPKMIRKSLPNKHLFMTNILKAQAIAPPPFTNVRRQYVKTLYTHLSSFKNSHCVNNQSSIRPLAAPQAI